MVRYRTTSLSFLYRIHIIPASSWRSCTNAPPVVERPEPPTGVQFTLRPYLLQSQRLYSTSDGGLSFNHRAAWHFQPDNAAGTAWPWAGIHTPRFLDGFILPPYVLDATRVEADQAASPHHQHRALGGAARQWAHLDHRCGGR